MSIKCGAHNCVHNDNNGNCYAGVVNVRGTHALTTDETLCKSFADQDLKADAEFATEFNLRKQVLIILNVVVVIVNIMIIKNVMLKTFKLIM